LLGVHVDVTQPVKKLSAAYQQLVSIARALAYSPKLLILDEPTAVLTKNEKREFVQIHEKTKKKMDNHGVYQPSSR